MNDSSQRIAFLSIVGVVVGAALLFAFFKMFWSPWTEALKTRNGLEVQVAAEEKRATDARALKRSVAKWEKLSLPNNFDRAAAEYGKMLKPLLRDQGLTVEDFKGPPPHEQSATPMMQKKPKHVVLTFSVRAKGTMESLAKTLEALQRMPVMHRVSTLVVDRADVKDKTGRLNVNMTIEAVIVNGSNNQPKLTGELGPPVTDRKYADMALRNPFVGYVPPPPPPPPPKVIVKEEKKEDPPEEPPPGLDVKEYIRLDVITLGEGGTGPEAFLHNMAQRTPPLRLRSQPMSGYDTFRIMDEDRTKTLLRGKVLRIGERDVYFQVGEEIFQLHFNQTLADALRRPLRESEMERLELTPDADFAKGEKKGKASATKKGR